MSYEKNHIVFDGTDISIEKPARFEEALYLPYNATSTETGSIRVSTSGALEYYNKVQESWVEPGGRSNIGTIPDATRGEACSFCILTTSFGPSATGQIFYDKVGGVASIDMGASYPLPNLYGQQAFVQDNTTYISGFWPSGISNTRTSHLTGVSNSYDMCLEILMGRTVNDGGDFNLAALPISAGGGGLGVRYLINSISNNCQLIKNNAWDAAAANYVNLAGDPFYLIHINQHHIENGTCLQEIYMGGIKVHETSFLFTTSTSALFVGGGLLQQRCPHFALWTSTYLTEEEIKENCRLITPNSCYFEF